MAVYLNGTKIRINLINVSMASVLKKPKKYSMMYIGLNAMMSFIQTMKSDTSQLAK